MKAAAALCAVMLALGAAQAVSADPAWFTSEPSSHSQAKTSSYYADALETELACLSQTNFRSCRTLGANGVNGGNAGREGADLFVQTDFGCCSKEHRHGHREDIGIVGTDGKIGTCDWNFQPYSWYSINGVDIAPVLTADGSAYKFGTVTGTCHFSSAAEQCDHPLCERMVLSFQGGLYVSRAYGFVKGPTAINDYPSFVFAPSQDTCAGESPNLRDWPFNIRRVGAKTQAASASAPAPATSGSTPAAKQAAGDKLPNPTGFELKDYLSAVMSMGMHYLGLDMPGGCLGPCERSGGAGSSGTQKPAEATKNVKASMANADYAHAPEEQTYAGFAMVISGPFSVVSSNDNQIKQTGIMEFAPTFIAAPNPPALGATELVYTPVRPTNKWPIVRGQTAKLRFTKEKEEAYSGKDSYQGEGKDSYHAHEPEHKDAYYGDNKDYGREYYREANRS